MAPKNGAPAPAVKDPPIVDPSEIESVHTATKSSRNLVFIFL